MPAKTFCLASPKGGSGKTIITATLGAFLAGLGKKVLIIDADAATNGLTLFYLKDVTVQNDLAYKNKQIPLGLFELTYQRDLDLNIKKIIPEKINLPNEVHFIPATYKQPLDIGKLSKEEFIKILHTILTTEKDKYDYIFIDTQAGYGSYAKVCMNKYISDEVIIVSEWDPISNTGILRLNALLKEDLNPDRTWILYNKLLPDFAKIYDEYLKHIYSKELPTIPWDADVVKAYVTLNLALDMENGNDHTLAIIRIVKSLLGENISLDLNTWMNRRVSVIRQPLEKQYEELEGQLKENIRLMDRLEYENEKRIIKKAFIYTGFVALGIIILFGIFLSVFKINTLTVWGVLIFEVVLLALLLIIRRTLSSKMKENPDYQFDKSRLLRQQSVLEERLKKLEALRTADLETLIKSKRIE